MELKQLEFFLTISRTKSFTRAAEQLFVSQPSITAGIKKLEEELGIKMMQNEGKVIGGARRDQYHDFFDVCLFEKNINIDDIDIEKSEVAG